jgi:hypothetical protein
MIRYRHYKGGIYEFISDATIEADLTPAIVYRAPDGSVWVRTREVFFEDVEVDGRTMPRFALME